MRPVGSRCSRSGKCIVWARTGGYVHFANTPRRGLGERAGTSVAKRLCGEDPARAAGSSLLLAASQSRLAGCGAAYTRRRFEGGRDVSAAFSRLDLGSYEAPRAASLAGVPLSTVYDWARKDVVVPSISPSREKLWSYGDLLTLRLVRWLRSDKSDARRTAMAEVRAMLDRFADGLWHEAASGHARPTIAVDASGHVFHVQRSESVSGQRCQTAATTWTPSRPSTRTRTPPPWARRCGSSSG